MNSEIRTAASNVVGVKRHLRMGSPSPLGRERGGERGSGLSFEDQGEEERPPRKVSRISGDDREFVGKWEVRDGEKGRGGIGEPVTPKKAVVGLGLGLGSGAGARVPWGTPGSLYDRDGFLKE